MKSIKITIAALAISATFAFTTKEKASTTYKVDNKLTTATWVGKKVTGQHTGAISVATGKVEVAGKDIKGGEFEIDMNSITCTDLDAEYGGKLVGHLKADDFFGTDKFPTAKFVLKSVKNNGKDNYEVSGDLTIKGKTNPVTFPAVIKMDDKKFVAVSTITVDRTKFDIKYGSKSFVEGIGDKAINDDFEIKLNLVATK
ncbi:MAG: YceI family protein [Bacteroidota bacterium]